MVPWLQTMLEVALTAKDSTPQGDLLVAGAGVAATGAGLAGMHFVRKKIHASKRFTREEAEAIVRRMEHVSHGHHPWDEERKEREIKHIMTRHTK